MNDIGVIGQAFIDTLFAQLHSFWFICLLQPRSFTMVVGKVLTSDLIIYLVTTQLSLKDESERIYISTFALFPIKLGQYSIILELSWFKKYLLHF